MKRYYSDEGNIQILLALLKQHNIRYIVASPGNTNLTLVASLQYDKYFKIISSVDERSAAYIACGIAEETGEPVMLSCTGATSSRNYMSGLTEAYYRKLPILAVTSSRDNSEIGHLVAQVTDRRDLPADVVTLSVQLPIVKDNETRWDCEIKVNKALLELRRNGGSPVHINIPTIYSKAYNTKELPDVRHIDRFFDGDIFPKINHKKVAVLIGSHARFNEKETSVLDAFCESNNAIVICDHTSGYYGKYRVNFSIIGGQQQYISSLCNMDLVIHIGEVSGDYLGGLLLKPKEIWRVNPDGELRDTLRKLKCVFEMPEITFFKHYTTTDKKEDANLKQYREACDFIYNKIDPSKIPFSNIYVAYNTSSRLPVNSRIHFGILSCLRSWGFFNLPVGVYSNCNVGGFGIDGCVSSLVGSSIVNTEDIHFGVFGDLTFFYDMNVLGNRHVGSNLRIILINNGVGAEFGLSCYPGSALENDVLPNISAQGHFGNKSSNLVRHYAESLNFEYIKASNKEEFECNIDKFTSQDKLNKSIIFEIFTDSLDEDKALYYIRNLVVDAKGSLKNVAKSILSEDKLNTIKSILNKK